MSHASIRKKLLSWMDFLYNNYYVFRWNILAFGVGYVFVYPEFFTLYLFNSFKNPQISSVDMISLCWTLNWCYKHWSNIFPQPVCQPFPGLSPLRPWPLYSSKLSWNFDFDCCSIKPTSLMSKVLPRTFCNYRLAKYF